MNVWLSRQHNIYNKKIDIMNNPNIIKLYEDFLDKYKKYLLTNKEKWESNFEKVKKYIDEHKKKPSESDTDPDTKFIGVWINIQQTKIIKDEGLMKIEYFRKKWENFIIEYKKYFITNEEAWKSNLENVKKYINENNKSPSISDKNNDTQILGQWISTQHKNYSREENIMKTLYIKKIWEDFINDNKQHYESNEEKWIKQLNKVKQFIDEHKIKPNKRDKNSYIKSLGIWLSNHKTNYVKNMEIMKYPDIRKQWEKFNDEYKIYLNMKL